MIFPSNQRVIFWQGKDHFKLTIRRYHAHTIAQEWQSLILTCRQFADEDLVRTGEVQIEPNGEYEGSAEEATEAEYEAEEKEEKKERRKKKKKRKHKKKSGFRDGDGDDDEDEDEDERRLNQIEPPTEPSGYLDDRGRGSMNMQTLPPHKQKPGKKHRRGSHRRHGKGDARGKGGDDDDDDEEEEGHNNSKDSNDPDAHDSDSKGDEDEQEDESKGDSSERNKERGKGEGAHGDIALDIKEPNDAKKDEPLTEEKSNPNDGSNQGNEWELMCSLGGTIDPLFGCLYLIFLD